MSRIRWLKKGVFTTGGHLAAQKYLHPTPPAPPCEEGEQSGSEPVPVFQQTVRRFGRRLLIVVLSGWAGMSVSHEDAARAGTLPEAEFQTLDRDGKGFVTLDEFLADVAGAERDARQWKFYERDFDADGRLSEKELAAEDSGEICPHLQNFRKADVDHNGSLSREEYVSPARPKYEEAAIQEFSLFDRDANGVLTYDEFCFSARIDLGREAKFRRLDTDLNGRLSCTEFLRPYAAAAQATQRSVFYHWDADNDQQLSPEEFSQQGQGVTLSLKNKYLARDLDDDGRLSREEYFHPFIGSQWDQAARNEAAQSDVDRDGFLTLLEFSFTPQEQPYADEVFPLMDADGDGLLSRAEFVKPYPRVRWPEAGARFCRYDRNADGRLDRDEFLHQGQGDWMRPDAVVEMVERLVREIEAVCAGVDASGRLTARDWPQQKIERIAGELVGLSFREWDRDGDGVVTETDRRLLVEIAFGVRRVAGDALRKPSGYVLNLWHIRSLDKNRDNAVSREEYVAGHPEDPHSAKSVQEWDKDGDGRLTFGELAAVSWIFADVFREFCRVDADADGRVTSDELLALTAPWQKSLAARLVGAFDRDGDRALGLDEYVLTPLANPLADWYVPHADADNDGKLSWTEFYGERSPFLYGLVRHFFMRFDRDGDGFLSRAEFDFPIDLEKVPPEAALAALDANADGRLEISELVELERPKTDDPTAILRWEEKTMRVEEAFRVGDADGDGVLTVGEFGKQQASLVAAILGKAPPSSLAPWKAGAAEQLGGTGYESWNWRFIGIAACNALLLVGIGWMVLRRA